MATGAAVIKAGLVPGKQNLSQMATHLFFAAFRADSN